MHLDYVMAGHAKTEKSRLVKYLIGSSPVLVMHLLHPPLAALNLSFAMGGMDLPLADSQLF